MFQAAGDHGFENKLVNQLRFFFKLGSEQFERHLTAQVLLPGFIDNTHASFSELVFDDIVGDFGIFKGVVDFSLVAGHDGGALECSCAARLLPDRDDALQCDGWIGHGPV